MTERDCSSQSSSAAEAAAVAAPPAAAADAVPPAIGAAALLALPTGVLVDILGRLASSQCNLADIAAVEIACKELQEAANAALASWTAWSSSDHREVSHMKAARLFKFLARHCPALRRISCCFAADRLYGGTLLESSLGCLAASTHCLQHLTLLNVDVNDAVLGHLARHCPHLQHLAIGRTEHNAFGSFITDSGLTLLAAACKRVTSLCLFRCYSCSDAGLRELARQGLQLTSLVLHSCPQITAPGLVRFIEATPMMQLLDVLLPESGPGGSAVNFDTCFALAAHCGGLRTLRLSEELISGGVLDDACLSVIARGCRQLQELEIVQAEVTDAAATDLATYCTQLTSLRLEQTYVGDVGVGRVLAACPNLQELRVAGCSTHSWMLPAEYMFAGLSVAGLRKVAAARGAGAKLACLDLSCLALEQQQDQQEAVLPVGIAAATVVVNAPAAAAAAAAAAPAPAPAAAAAMVVAAVPAGVPASIAAAQAPAGAGSSNSSTADAHPAAADAQLMSAHLRSPLLLLPAAWCQQLTSLSLDWLKVDPHTLQEPLVATLRCCGSLTKLSLVGYQGSVDGLLAAAAAAAAAGGDGGPASSAAAAPGMTQLNLQHSQVTDVGLGLAARAFPRLLLLFLSYCRQVGDAGLASVLQMQQLQELDLYNTPCVSTAAVARVARHAPSLRRIFIGHNTSALNRGPAQTAAMSFISSSERAKYASTTTTSVWAAVSEAAARRAPGAQLSVLCRNPSSESEFEKRTLAALLVGGGGGGSSNSRRD